MLCSSCQSINLLLVKDPSFDFEWFVLIFFLSIKKHIVHAETPRIEAFFIVAKSKLRACCDMVNLIINRDRPNALNVEILLN